MYAKAKKMKDDALAKVAIAKEKAKTMQDKAHSFAKKVGLVKTNLDTKMDLDHTYKENQN